MSSSSIDDAEKGEKKKISPLGLNSEERSVPLKSIKVDVQITGYVAEVTSTLTYFNTEESPVEAVFTFPVDDGSAVFQFEADIDGRHIVAEIQEREQAQLTYDDAVQNGKTAMLLKEDTSAGDIFSCMLGNLPAQSEASLVMKYVIELTQEPGGQLKFTLPTVLNPRYSPDVGVLVAAEGATYVPPSKVPYEFSLTARIKGYHKVTSVTSDTVKLDVQFEENNKIAKVCLGDDFKFDHDLGFLVQYEKPYSPQIVLEDGNPEAEGLLKEDMLMISFHPDLKEVAMATNGEYIFVIDRSGSMHGDLIENAKEALFLFLKSLPTDCYFNVISFGSRYSSLFSSGSKKYAEATLNEAISLQENMDADMGGTEILKPLEHIFSRKVIPEHPRTVFVLTDGGVSNTNQVIGLVKKESKKTSTRVFTLGIGSGVSTALVKGIAKNGGGKSEFIADKDRIQPKVISLLKCAMQPAITEITIDWDLPPDITPVTIPTELPDLISPNERLTLYAILQNVNKHAIYAPSTMTLKGIQDGEKVSHTLTFTLCEADDINESAPVHRLATKLEIKLLQDQESAEVFDDGYHYNCESIQASRKKIVCLSCQGNIISKYTSFVAIDTEGKKVEGKAVQKSCPVPSLTSEFVMGIQDSALRGCSLQMCGLYDIADSMSESSGQKTYGIVGFTRSSRKKRKMKGSLFGCGPSLSSIFSKKSKSKKAPLVKSASNSRQAAGVCADNGGDMIDQVLDEADGADINLSVDGSETDRVEEDRDSTTEGTARKQSTEIADNNTSQLKDDQMITVIGLQQLQGQWNMSDQLLQLLGVTKGDMDKLTFSEDSSVVCTVLVLAWLRTKFSHRQEEWQMIEAKALTWISSNNPSFTTEIHIKQTREVMYTD